MLPFPALLLRRLRLSELNLRFLIPRLLPAQWTCSQESVSSVVRESQVTTPLIGLTRWRYSARVTSGATVRAPPLFRWAFGLVSQIERRRGPIGPAKRLRRHMPDTAVGA